MSTLSERLGQIVNSTLLVSAREYAEAHRDALQGSPDNQTLAELERLRFEACVTAQACVFASAVVRSLCEDEKEEKR